MNFHALFDDRTDRHTGIQRGIRILEDNLRLLREVKSCLRRMKIKLLSVIVELSLRRLVDAHKRPPERRLTAARLTDEAKRFATINFEVHILNGMQRTSSAHTEIF